MATVTKLDIGMLNNLSELIVAQMSPVDEKFDEEPIAQELLKNLVNKNGPGMKQHVIVDRGNTFGYESGGNYSIVSTDPTALLQFTWKNLAAVGMIPLTTSEFSKDNKEAFGNLLEIQLDVMYKSLLHDLAQQFRGVSVANVANPMQAFSTIAAASGTYGGLSRTTYPVLNGLTIDITAAPYSCTTIAHLTTNNNLINILGSAIRRCSAPGKQETSTVIFVPGAMWECLDFIGNQVYSPIKPTDAGKWGSVAWDIKGVPAVYDAELPEGSIMVCNFNYLDLVTHPSFDFTFSGWKESDTSDNLVGLMKLSGEIVSIKPKRQCIITNLPTSFTLPLS